MRPDIKKRRDKYTSPTLAQRIFAEKEILTKRPEGMSYSEYAFARVYQQGVFRELIKGAPNKKIASRMIPRQPSEHLLKMVFNAQLKKIEAQEALLPKETPHEVTFIDRIFNCFRGLTGRNYGAREEEVVV